MALRHFLLAVAGAAAFFVPAQSAPPAAVSAYLPTTCQPGVAGDCVRAIPVVNPDGSNIGGTAPGQSAGDPSYTGANASATIPSNIAVTGGWDGTNLRRFLTDTSGRQVVNVNGSVAVTGTFWQTTQPVSGTVTANLAAGSNAIGSITNTGFNVTGTLPAYAAIPTFKLDQTTPGTTNGVVVNSSALPNGAATSANQTTELSTLSTISGQLPATLGAKTSAASTSFAPASDATFVVGGPAASLATASGNPVKTGCVYSATPPTAATTQIVDCQADTRGNTKVTIAAGAGTASVDTASGFSGSLTVVPAATSAFGAGVAVATATATSGVVIKASQGNLYGLVVNNSTTAGYVCVVNSTTVPADGAVTDTTVLYAMPIAVSTGLHETFSPPIPFTTGMSMYLSSSYCSTKAAITGNKLLGYYK